MSGVLEIADVHGFPKTTPFSLCSFVLLFPLKHTSPSALFSKPSADQKTIVVSVPPTRSDILHPCDVVEDVAISYGYNKLPRSLPTAYTISGV